jgi:ferric-dicitrate binding protein FerR (iron transport regulator)
LPAVAQAQSEPPGRIGRLAYTQGTVSFHDPQQEGWTQAIPNTPLTSGDALWTEPNAHSEVSLAGTRVRMDGATQLDMLAVDDSQTRLQLDQGRIDVRSFAMDPNQPYQVLTPRGTVSLLQQGDYYVEGGSQQDPTRLGVRTGGAAFQALN